MRALAITLLSILGVAFLSLFIYLMLDSSSFDNEDEWPDEKDSDD
jgi:hypothetical protein